MLIRNEDFNSIAIEEFDSLLTSQVQEALGSGKYKTANAKKLLNEFCSSVRNQFNSKGEPYKKPPNGSTDINIDPRLAWYLLGCIEKILDKNGPIDPKQALNLKEPYVSGKKVKQADPDRKIGEMRIANDVSNLVKQGIGLEVAFAEISCKYYPSDDTKGYKAVRDAYYEYRIESQAKRVSNSTERYVRAKKSI
ncbi:hypothetical protein ACQE3E_15440 [Methylomonas sp. MED-D]|uniref:hypothetical protein n=1 Tax=Methylomonas sp. MED-D TaxID=3418768 RepID=UPI003CFBF8BC